MANIILGPTKAGFPYLAVVVVVVVETEITGAEVSRAFSACRRARCVLTKSLCATLIDKEKVEPRELIALDYTRFLHRASRAP